MNLNPPVRWWRCPSCGTSDRTQRPDVHMQFHGCPALGGLTAPLVEVAGPDDRPDARHVAVTSEDYVGARPSVTAIRTDRGDGSNDVTVFAPSASAGASTNPT